MLHPHRTTLHLSAPQRCSPCRLAIVVAIVGALASCSPAENPPRSAGNAAITAATTAAAPACVAPRTITGDRCTVETLTTDIGGFSRDYQVHTVSGTGARLELTFPRPVCTGDLLLEIQEIHQRRPRAFGYTVAVNGTEVNFRTYAEHGAGPNHHLIKVPLTAITGSGDLTVTLTSAGAPPFSIGQVRLWGDFFTRLDREEGIYRPMALIGKHTTLPAGQPGFTSFGPLGDFSSSSYANTPIATTRKRMLESITRSAESGRPMQFLINGPTWGGAMSGPDGRGGYYNDIRYSLLSYDAANRSYAASFPNMWSSAFWAAFRDPWVNTEMRRRLTACLEGSADAIDLLKARGKTPQPNYLREMGPPMGEITAATIATAAKDGLVLDPTDGISAAERAWLFQDGVRIWQEYAATNRELLQRDSAVVDRGQVTLPSDQLILNQYSHTVFRSEGPMKDRRWFGGQMGIVDGFWSTGELFWDEAVMYDYVKANGKLVHGNLEGTILKGDATPLVKLYSAGFQYVNFFNEPKDVLDDVRKADGCDDQPMPAPQHHEPLVFTAPYNHTASLGAPVSSDNIGIHSQPRENADSITASRLAVMDVARSGQVTYRLDNGGEPFPSGFSLHLDGRVSPGEANRIVVLLGDSPDTLRPMATVTAKELPCPDHWTPFMTSTATVDLGAAMKGKTSQHLRFELHAAGAPDAAFLLEASVGTQWPRTTGPLAGNGMTRRETRTTQLWIQDRAVAHTALARFAELDGDAATATQARTLFEAGRYRSAQKLLAGALAEVLPARYAVRGHGPLGRHPVQVRLPQDDQAVVVTLHRVGVDGCEFSLATDAERQAVELSVPTAGWSGWTVAQVGPNRYRLAVDGAGVPAALVDGRAVARVDAVTVKPAARTLPRTLVARCLDYGKNGIRFDSQDRELLGLEDSLTLPLAPEIRTSRAPERLSAQDAKGDDPRAQDRVELTIDDQGRVTTVKALYGRDAGTIAAITAPNPMGPVFSNGTITLDNGNTYEFSYGTRLDTVPMHGRYADYETRHITEGLRPGQRVEVAYSPYAELGTTRRLIQVTQPNRVLMQEDYYTTTDDSWKTRAVSVEGLVVALHKAEPNYMHDAQARLLRPAKHFVPGSIVYRITSDQPLTSTVVEFQARAFEDSSTVDFAVSRDNGVTWIPCGRFGNTWQNSYPQGVTDFKRMPWQFIDLTKAVNGANGFLLKATLAVNSADERYCVSSIRVVTER
jgi:hypothetical protein